MFSKKRGLPVLSGFVSFLAGLYLFVIMASDFNFKSFLVLTVFALFSLYLAVVIGQNLVADKKQESDSAAKDGDLVVIDLKEKLGYLKAENLRLLKMIEMENQKTHPAEEVGRPLKGASGLMLRQRAFMHDIAGPVSIVQGMIEMALSSLETDPKDSAKAKAKLEKALVSVSRISQKVKENRDYLIMSAS